MPSTSIPGGPRPLRKNKIRSNEIVSAFVSGTSITRSTPQAGTLVIMEPRPSDSLPLQTWNSGKSLEDQSSIGPRSSGEYTNTATASIHHSISSDVFEQPSPGIFRSGVLLVLPSTYPPSISLTQSSLAEPQTSVSDHRVSHHQIDRDLLPDAESAMPSPETGNLSIVTTSSLQRHADASISAEPCERLWGGSMRPSEEELEEGLLNAGHPRKPSRATDSHLESVEFPRDSYDKPRRLLLSPSLGILSITLRGSINRTERSSPRGAHVLRPGADAINHFVDDACLLRSSNGGFLLLGHASDGNELSMLRVKKDRAFDISTFGRPAHGEKKGGVSAVCSMMQPLMFATGGYDHRVHLWDATKSVSQPSPTLLAITHSSLVQSLLPIRDTSHKLVSAGADCNVHLWDLSSERVVNTMKTSNSVYHVHGTSLPFCTLLEVAHRELQFEVRDYRLVPEKPVQRFGYDAPKVHGRYARGDINASTFACGDRDGCVRLWDLRNTASGQVLPCFRGQRATQIHFDGACLIACSEEHEVVFIPRGLS